MLHINDLTYRIGNRLLFDHASASVASGWKVGLVGRNGCGKTTLFRMIMGEAHPESGDITIGMRTRLGWVAQEAPEGERTLVECVLAADTERTELLTEEARLLAADKIDAHRIADIHERLNAIEAHSAPSRAASILSGLGFDEEAQKRPVGSFSGGWRMRVALAGALFRRTDLLLLDEPTNHLDLEAALWLEEYLGSCSSTLLIISHDRRLLNTVTNRILHIENGKLVAYGGNYDQFETTRRERMDLTAKAAVQQEDQRRKLQAFIDRFRAKATKARQAQSRVKMLEKLGPPIAVVEERSYSFDFPDPDPLAPPIITLENAEAGYEPGKPILRRLSLRIDMDDRIALLGANGNGKSTLAKTLAQRLPLLSGKIQCSSKLRVGYFAQHQTDEMSPETTPYALMADLMPNALPAKIRAQLGRFGFENVRADMRIADLSGGEKARLLFALVSREAPHLMILDEPTNHLDIDSREALVQALSVYEGAVILISHDPHLIELTADRLWLIGDGLCRPFDGDLDDYRKLLIEQNREKNRSGETGEAGNSRKEERRAAAAARERLAPLRKVVQKAESLLEKLTARKIALEEKLADPLLYDGPPDKIAELQRQRADIIRQTGEAETAWLEAQENLELAQSAD